jgi:type 2 lantibiotic biosynthesis protein LanM
MDQLSFQASTWYHAMTLTERIASLRDIQTKMPSVKVNADLAGRRLQRWKSQPPFAIGSHFAQRLKMDGITEADLLYFLGEPVEAVHDRFPTPPDWLAEIAQAFSQSSPVHPSSRQEVLSGQEIFGLLDGIEPLIRQGHDRLRQRLRVFLRTSSCLPFYPNTIEGILFEDLLERLLMIAGRTMVLELNVARLQGVLQGNTAKERFQNFLQRLHHRDIALTVLQEYPVLARQLMVCIDNWVNHSLEFLQRLCTDWEAIRTTFSPESDPGVLVQVEGNMSDNHRGGRSVQIARFSSGFQVVYKPRALALDVHFQDLLVWINGRGDHPPFRILKILDRGTYGWVECIVAQDCHSLTEVRCFYERQGGYLALLYALEAIDFHAENLIAVGEHPILLDLEALFHPRVEGIDIPLSALPTSNTMAYSVLRVGLLPCRIWASAGSEGIDVSGIGAVSGQLTPFEVPWWEGVGTDEMRLIHKQGTMPETRNRPTINGVEVDVLDYTEEIANGFTSIYRLLQAHRDDLLSDNGALAWFAADEVRVILRATRTYSLLLHESFHPDVLRNALDRDRLFDRLWIDAEHLPYLVGVVPAEREDLQKGDIPIFTTHPSSRDVWSSSKERIANFFAETGMALVRRRVQHLSDNDLAQQLWFIRASLATLVMGKDAVRLPTYRLTEPRGLVNREQLLGAAQAVADRLEALALRSGHDVGWIGSTLTNERHWSPVPLGIDLYSGLPGVALFLAYLGAITRERRYISLAQATLTTIHKQVEHSRPFIKSIGGFHGWGGLIYTLTHLGLLWDRFALLTEAETIVGYLPSLVGQDELLDIIAGAAGCIGSLISLYHCSPSDCTLKAAIQCGDRLIARAQLMEYGIGWEIQAAGTKPLAGFSHGAAGIAWALLELAALTGEERFRTAALAAIAYERSLFSSEAGNWLDLRELETSRQAEGSRQNRFMTAWCHGAPGIGLARLCSLRHLDDAAIRAEIETALQTTLAQGFGGNHSLCHGDLGNLELLLQASQVLEEPQWRAQVDCIAAIILESISRDGWLCGTPLGVESPGLMTGLAGIGYGLLRLAEPTRVPSVLMLEPPRRHE